jgi:undecaprenyl-diphosphatase
MMELRAMSQLSQTVTDQLALAVALGTHALPLFLLLLTLLLLVVAAVWWLLGTHVLPRARSGLPRTAFVLLNAGLGFAIVVAAAAGFAEIAEELVTGTSMAHADEAFSGALRSHVGAPALQVFAVLTHLGDVWVLAVLGGVLALWLWWRRQHALALGWVLALGGNALLNPLLKRVFERVRPIHDPGFASATGWSFPSGHTSGATVAYGMLTYVMLRTLPAAWHLPALLGAAALAFTVGCSRVFLQVHFVSDVVAGFASGSAWLVVCILSVELSRKGQRREAPAAIRLR